VERTFTASIRMANKMPRPDLRTNSDRFRQAEKDGKIRAYHYSYSPRGTTADTRHVIVDANGTERVILHKEAAAYLRDIGA
jgi:hypothetical protein